MDFSRRGFLRAASAGALTVAIGGGLRGHAYAAEAHIKSVHGSGFSNLNYFLTEDKQLAKDDGVILDFVLTPTSAEMVTFLGAGQVDAALIPYTSFIALYDRERQSKSSPAAASRAASSSLSRGSMHPKSSKERRSARSRWIPSRCCPMTG
jgi:hypothetical protein